MRYIIGLVAIIIMALPLVLDKLYWTVTPVYAVSLQEVRQVVRDRIIEPYCFDNDIETILSTAIEKKIIENEDPIWKASSIRLYKPNRLMFYAPDGRSIRETIIPRFLNGLMIELKNQVERAFPLCVNPPKNLEEQANEAADIKIEKINIRSPRDFSSSD